MRQLLTAREPILQQQWVALDLETTGLSPSSDAIIEVGAVRFRGNETLDTLSTFVNPKRQLSDFIVGYTGITQADVDSAPSPDAALSALSAFVGADPVVGHNIRFDLSFLVAAGLSLTNPTCDTWELAFVIRPGASSYALSKLASELGVGHDRPHRALDDAAATAKVFAILIAEAAELEIDVLSELDRTARRSDSRLAYAMAGLAETAAADLSAADDGPTLGFDIAAIRRRSHSAPALRTAREPMPVDTDAVAAALELGGPLDRSMQGFEHRKEQVKMARAVAETINTFAAGEEGRLIVEAGTGVGKSLAYLLPAALYALSNDARVVVSTNTINLQEQLLSKDLPIVTEAITAMAASGQNGLDASRLRATQLKGRSNYLCLSKLLSLRSSEFVSEPDARMLSKLLVWLRSTATGDRSELNLGNRAAAEPWNRLSAQGASGCTGVAGTCFLRSAREQASSAHLIIVNHALLMADLATDGSILPEHDLLIVDEAHHLEESATRQLGFEIGQATAQDHLAAISGQGGLLARSVGMVRAEPVSDSRRQTVEKIAEEVSAMSPRIRESLAGLLAEAAGVAESSDEGPGGGERPRRELRVTRATRAQPAWSGLEASWERTDLLLAELSDALSRLIIAMEDMDEANLPGYTGLMVDAAEMGRENEHLRIRLSEFFPQPQGESVYWISRSSQMGRRPPHIGLHAAPLSVGDKLEEMVYSRTGAVVMTSATLAADGSFGHLVDRTGFDHAQHLLVGSPFDYPNAALICLPDDLPEPSSWAYQGVLEQAVVDAAVAAGGHTMVLFTSYASLQQAAKAVRPSLRPHDISVLAQGTDGTPHRIVADFIDNPRSVILGTASFWEGVDLPGDTLKVLLVTRLPFAVPTDPIVSARSEMFEDPFRQYSLPEAILRLRQGFGRLIRTSSDRGVAVILDRRIISKSYGKSFARSLPPATLSRMPLGDVPRAIGRFLDAEG